MHYLVTGHTGFKGSWLALMLADRGHVVSGVALDPRPGSLYERARVHEDVAHDIRVDVRDRDAVVDAVRRTAPDVVIHMAAQPLVRESYRDPRATFETNVMGTLNMLEAASASDSVQAHVVVTTDKVYRNIEKRVAYIEDDALGSGDPYSSSKAMADILAQSWSRSFDGPPIGIARGGNVIGGGDDNKDRLLPDLLAAFADGIDPVLRFPEAVRPWQHVLDCLSGYLALAEALLDGRGSGEWNFGPAADSFVTVGEVARAAAEMWGHAGNAVLSEGEHPSEAGLLALDSAKAVRELGWTNRMPFPDSLQAVIDWHVAVSGGADPRQITIEQIRRFESKRIA